MCYVVKSKNSIADLKKKYNALYDGAAMEPPRHDMVSGFAHPMLPVITSEKNDSIQLMEWGLVPAWVKDEKAAADMQNATLNARSETLFEKPSFRSIIKRRCLILVNGFYEWQHRAKEKVPYFIHLKEEAIFALGGLYDEWVNTNTGELYKGFSIITVPANPLMAAIHNTKKRMPLILPEGREREWLKSDVSEGEIKSMLIQYPEEKMVAEEIKKEEEQQSLF